jgi:hypothetical protein
MIGKILNMLLGSKKEGGGAGEFAKDIREALKGKEIDPNKALELISVQTELTKVEAQHRTVFVAGWRPFIGWVAGVALAAFYIPQFIMASYLWVTMVLEAKALLPYPEVNANHLFELIIGMLGLGALRTYEKIKDKTK